LIYYLHIPRTAGTSFAVDAKRSLQTFENVVKFKTILVDKEGCYDWRKEIKDVQHVAVMFRNPRSHVYSQYLMCGEGPVNIMTSVPPPERNGFREWLFKWKELESKGAVVGDFARGIGLKPQLKMELKVTYSTLPFHCYNPFNMQTHHLTCQLPFKYRRKLDVKQAVQNMQDSWYVGIVEAYQESVCLMHVKVFGKLPEYCDCTDPVRWGSFQQTHTSFHDNRNIRTPPVASQPKYVIDLIDELTSLDQILYKASVERFLKDIKEVEDKHAVKILCDSSRLRLQLNTSEPEHHTD